MSSYHHIKAPGLSKWRVSVRQAIGLLMRMTVQNLMAHPKDLTWDLTGFGRLRPDELLTSLALIL